MYFLVFIRFQYIFTKIESHYSKIPGKFFIYYCYLEFFVLAYCDLPIISFNLQTNHIPEIVGQLGNVCMLNFNKMISSNTLH
jgi:hypothetical protein